MIPLLMILGSFLFGTLGFMIIGNGKWNMLDCAYMTSITLTGVGYGEILEPMIPSARLFAMIVMWSGMGVVLYSVSTITALVVEKNEVLARSIKERKMQKRIAAMSQHIIICGAGPIGMHVVKELYTTKYPCVVIEHDHERCDWISKNMEDLPLLNGDAMEETFLHQAGIERAAGILITLHEASRNMLITVQSRCLNPSIRIVVRCDEPNLVDKFYRAGASYVVNPSFIGGMRMASEMIRPHVVSFLDQMLRGRNQCVRVEEVILNEGSSLSGLSLKESDIYGRTGLMPIALKYPDEEEFLYNPSPESRLKEKTVIIVIGSPEQIGMLRNMSNGKGLS